MQTCFFKLAEDAAGRGGDRRTSRTPSRRPTARRGAARSSSRTSPRSTAPWPTCTKVNVPGQVTSSLHMVPPVPAKAPQFVQGRAGDDDRQPRRRPAGERDAGRRHVPHRHHDVREAEHRPGHPHLGREDLHPVRPLLAGLPARLDPHEGLRPGAAGRAPRPASCRPTGRARSIPGWKFTRAGGARRLHGLRHVRRRLPGQEQGRGQAQGHQHGARSCRTWSAERANLDFFLGLPDVDRSQGQGRHGQGLAALAAAVRVLRGLRRLRRDALRQAAHPVLRRPDDDRQRHGLLVDLRRQPALHALHGRSATGKGPTWSNSLFEDCGRVRLRHAAGRRPADRLRRGAAAAARRRAGRRAGRGPARTTARRPTREIAASGPWWPS